MSTPHPDKPQNQDQDRTDPSPPHEETEDEGECGFCLFMKGGECRENFIDWEKCIEEGEKNNEDVVEKCFEVTSSLKKCMEAHPDYYGPILQAEKAAQQEAINQLDKEKEAMAAASDTEKQQQNH
ncbi:uncharacterized protein LOC112528164 [Cynara cardunculus var. scolymus]|uniref:GCK-like protein n=1 Tax=Cynara cardunculus var. scolymus TaxID=59895 RepID=A0A118JX23_CYNCS|nr:uncharacterized protein LOC112528164 [Cynara cardunculus var. scolymus]KVH96161.1 GCK-like protein [Cynara cardunculus var. scolymus]